MSGETLRMKTNRHAAARAVAGNSRDRRVRADAPADESKWPRSPKLPSLNAIRAFEAVGRLLSYSRAAQELRVTPSALSHQIRALETYFGVPLLESIGRKLMLTAHGAAYLREVSQGFSRLSLATNALLKRKTEPVLRIKAPPSFAQWWLLPRLRGFLTAHPGIVVDVSATAQRFEWSLEQCDAFIAYMGDRPSGLQAVPLGRNESIPVCSPLLLKGGVPLRTVADLHRHVLLVSSEDIVPTEPPAYWTGWLKAANQPLTVGARQLHFNPTGLVLQAAAEGLGVALARTLLVADAMASGRLVCPFGPAVPLSATYYLVCRPAHAEDRNIVAFRDWIVTEAHASVDSIVVPEGQTTDENECPHSERSILPAGTLDGDTRGRSAKSGAVTTHRTPSREM